MFIKLGEKTKIAVAGTAAAGAAPGTGGKYLLSTNTDCYIRLDAGTASASNFDLFLPAGGMVLIDKGPSSFNAIRDSADGVLVIHEID
jgi:hypothetical protein